MKKMIYKKDNFEFFFKDNNKPNNPIFFIHGLIGHSSNMNQFENNVKDHDYYFVVLPNHGKQIEKNKNISINYFAQKIANFIKRMNLKNITLMGHSMGGAVSLFLMHYVNEHIKNVILISPATPAIITKNMGFFSRTNDAKIIYHKIFKPNFKKIIKESKKIKKRIYSFKKDLKSMKNHFELINGDLLNYYNLPQKIFSTWFIKLLIDLTSFKSWDLFEKNIKENSNIRRIPILYIRGNMYDILTPATNTLIFLNSNFFNITNEIILGGAHMSFWVNYPDFEKSVYKFINNPKNNYKNYYPKNN